jgi:beta-galactosidase
VVVPSANDLITFSTIGSGVVAAVDSADNADHDPFQTMQRHAFQGRCVALIKANKATGRITISASASGLAGAKTTIGIGR